MADGYFERLIQSTPTRVWVNLGRRPIGAVGVRRFEESGSDPTFFELALDDLGQAADM